MKHIPIHVECYAGGRADERPRRVYVNNQVYVVARLVSTSVEESLGSKAQVRRYRVLTEDGWIFDLTCASGGWTLESKQRMAE